MKFNEIITLINEFDYRKNGIRLTIDFLEIMKEEAEKLYKKEVLKQYNLRRKKDENECI